MFARSAVKPLQALGSVRAGVVERFRLGTRHLAMACASHGGSPDHIAAVGEVLEACGLREEALACGPELPRDPRAAEDVRPSRIRHNCSGKHAFGLARCLHEGWPLDGYFRAGHPLQGAMRDTVAAACGVESATEEATDGCGMRTFALPLAGLARAFGALAGGGLGAAGDRCAGAMRAHPELVAYEGAIDTELMRAEDGLVAKIGAEGVLAVGLARRARAGAEGARRQPPRGRAGRHRARPRRAGAGRARPGRARRRADRQLARHPGRRTAECVSARLRQAVLERALDGRVERVQPVERERLGRAEAPAGRGLCAVMGQHAVQQRDAPLRREVAQPRLEQLRARARRGRAAGPRRSARSPPRRLNSRVLPRSWTSAAQISRSEFSRGCRTHVSCASVATATVCSSSPPR